MNLADSNTRSRLLLNLVNSLKLVPHKPRNSDNPLLKRRRKLIAEIDEQICLATDSDYKSTKIKQAHNEEGTERKLEIQKRERRWRSENLCGTVLLMRVTETNS